VLCFFAISAGRASLPRREVAEASLEPAPVEP